MGPDPPVEKHLSTYTVQPASKKANILCVYADFLMLHKDGLNLFTQNHNGVKQCITCSNADY